MPAHTTEDNAHTREPRPPLHIDILTIFPEFFDSLQLSLISKARQQGILSFGVHDLRTHSKDKHKKVDDTPAGGGPGMVMSPEPWGHALDSVLFPPENTNPVLIVPTPAGTPFTQTHAETLAKENHIAFACGRYEGIDQRVIEHYRTRVRVQEFSLGDFVLNGGEVAALAMTEAITRLIPGVLGNPESLLEESHSDKLLEYPNYTRPRLWRELEIPGILLSGDHKAVKQWRHEQSLLRTLHVRPDMLTGETLRHAKKIFDRQKNPPKQETRPENSAPNTGEKTR